PPERRGVNRIQGRIEERTQAIQVSLGVSIWRRSIVQVDEAVRAHVLNGSCHGDERSAVRIPAYLEAALTAEGYRCSAHGRGSGQRRLESRTARQCPSSGAQHGVEPRGRR